MINNWDQGLMEDFDNMTQELGREVKVYKRYLEFTHDEFENENTGEQEYRTETAFVQELDSNSEALASGILSVGDVRFLFKSDSIAEPEGYVIEGDTKYKIIEVSYIKGQSNNSILYIKAYGKKVPNR